MRKHHIQMGVGTSLTIITFFLVITGAIVAIVAALIRDVTIVAVGFSAMFAAIWMLSKRKPIRKM